LVPYLKSTSDDKKKIWVIDDDTIYQIIVTKIIQKTNLFSVTSSFDGKDGIEALIHAIENKQPLPGNHLIRYQYASYGRMGIYGRNGKTKTFTKRHISVYISSSSIAIEDKNNKKPIFNFRLFI
jgi:hypothetical protein